MANPQNRTQPPGMVGQRQRKNCNFCKTILKDQKSDREQNYALSPEKVEKRRQKKPVVKTGNNPATTVAGKRA